MITINFISWSAILLGVIHALTGPDHYVPFIALSRAQRWSTKKTVLITLGCGLAHLFISVLIAGIGLYFQAALRRLEIIESLRSELMGYGLIAFGLVYAIWALKHGFGKTKNFLWVYFLVFIFGPCEPAIPLLLYPDVQIAIGATILFSVATLGTMLSAVWVGRYGLSHLKPALFARYGHVFAGLSILLCGLAVHFLNL